MMVPWRYLNGRHLATSQCTRGAERKRRRLVEEELRDSSERDFQAYGAPLENVTVFKYLGGVMTAGDDDFTAVAGNLQKARKSWVRMSLILSREGADLKVSGQFFKAVVQAVLLFGAETWVLNPRMKRALSSFQHRFTQRLTGMQSRRRGDGSWYYPPLSGEMAEAGFKEIGVYVTMRNNTVTRYIVTRTIMELCERSDRRPGAWVSRRWWEKEGLNLEEAKERAVAESEGEEAQCEEEVLAQEDTTGRE